MNLRNKGLLTEVVFCTSLLCEVVRGINDDVNYMYTLFLRPFYMGQVSEIATKIPKIACEFIVRN